jgi:mono/diheme cytochrome c family protein
MMRSRHVPLLCAAVCLTTWSAFAAPPEPALPPDHAERLAKGQEIFTRHVRKILLDQCVKCHGGDKTSGRLDLTTRELLLKGGANGPVVVPFKSKDSRLYHLVAHDEMPHMPSKAPKLSDEQIAQLAAWIDNGAPYDKPLLDGKTVAKKPMVVTDKDRQFWAFVPLKRSPVPEVKDEKWCRTPIDRFILAKLDEKKLTPNPVADKRTLIRRAYFDLIGLPPTPEEIDAFVKDESPQAWEKVIDKLLASPHYGERWGRHWLDLARFAESNGYEHDYDRPTAYHYRDFVIKALNSDLPYDKFVQWQLAGDEIEPDNPLALAATGFLGAGVHSTQITKNQVEKERYDELDDMLRTTGTAMLGLTIGCARCHDHKFDPIPTKDYYRILSTFTTTVRTEIDLKTDEETAAKVRAAWDKEHAAVVEPLRKYETDKLTPQFDKWLMNRPADLKAPQNVLDVLAKLNTPDAKLTDDERQTVFAWYRTTDAKWRELNQKVEAHQKTAPKAGTAKAMICSEGLPAIRLHTQGGDFLDETHFLKRGDPNQKDGVATQSFLQVLMRTPEEEKRWQVAPPQGWRTSYRRRSLANWITDTDAGAGALLARVIVNRLWQHHMGTGIVATPSDFGYQGDKPTHPELLDWLAQELLDRGWRLKPIHKRIMMSAVYMQGTKYDKARAKIDDENRYYWRRTPRRLEAEIIRDNLLAVSGTLDTKQFGPGTLDTNMKRRSIYFFVKRSQLNPTMVLFDGPDALQGAEQRNTTTIAPQALLLMNNPFVRSCAESLAKRIAPPESKPLADTVTHAYLVALGRKPTARELDVSVAFLKEQTAAYQKDGKNNATQLALADFCQALMESNEFIYID